MAAPPGDVPKKVGRYEIRRELGRGMMGVVYEARDPALGRSVALKTIRLAPGVSAKERASYEQRFLTEARIAAKLSHPGIVVVHDIGRDADTGILYIALEHLLGTPLDEGLGQPSADWRKTLGLVAKVAHALHHAHSHGVVHRDIKPANIMRLKSGEPKIMDFGIAKLDSTSLTTTGQFFGTPLYMAPEQAQGGAIDGRTDLFSLGSVAYTLLTGKQPFKADSVPMILARVMHQSPPPPSKLVPALPADVDYCVARCMAKAPGDRYPDGRTLAEDLEDVVAGRPPRHQGKWRAPEIGEGTMVARRPDLAAAAENFDLLPLEPDETAASAPKAARTTGASPPPRKRRVLGSRPVAALTGMLLLAGTAIFAVAFFFQALPPEILSLFEALPAPLAIPSPAAPAAPTPSPTVVTHAAAPEPTTDTPESPLGAELAPVAAESGTDAAPPEATSEPTPEAPPRPDPTAPATKGAESGRGKLIIDFEHHLKSGTVKVWVDREVVLDESLDSRVTRKVLSFKVRKGKVEEVLELTPGRHEVRVEVRWDKKVQSRWTTRTFQDGVTRRLEVRVSRLTGNLSLEWK